MIFIFLVTIFIVPAELQPIYLPSAQTEQNTNNSSWAPNCPSGSGKIPLLIPHPYDCRSMFICSGGTPKQYICPDGEVFNVELQTCLERKECDAGRYKKWPAFETCPEVDDKPTYFKHPIDCSMFYQCGNGIEYPKRCPGELHFNPKKNVCDWPRNVNCKSRLYKRKFLVQEIVR